MRHIIILYNICLLPIYCLIKILLSVLGRYQQMSNNRIQMSCCRFRKTLQMHLPRISYFTVRTHPLLTTPLHTHTSRRQIANATACMCLVFMEYQYDMIIYFEYNHYLYGIIFINNNNNC